VLERTDRASEHSPGTCIAVKYRARQEFQKRGKIGVSKEEAKELVSYSVDLAQRFKFGHSTLSPDTKSRSAWHGGIPSLLLPEIIRPES